MFGYVGVKPLNPAPDVDPDLVGFYIVYLDPDGTSWDCIGPFPTAADAIRVERESRIFD